MPKPIGVTHHQAIGVLPLLKLDGQQQATFTTTPLYHGGIADCFRAWTSSAFIWFFPGDYPITPKHVRSCYEESILHAASLPKIQFFSAVPAVITALAAERDGLRMLQEMKIVVS